MESVNMTRVYLLNVPLENDYKHTIYFQTAARQHLYFTKRDVCREITNFSYQRKEGIMRIPLGFDEAVRYNYVMYQNYPNSSKWYYAFITNYEFKGDDQTNITLETDVMQTYMFNINIKPSFIEREHVDDDTIGLHTVPENLEVGEFVCVNRGQVEQLQKCDIVVGSTMAVRANGNIENAWGVKYNGIYSGIAYYTCDGTKIEMLNEWLNNFSEGHTDALKCMFLVPEFMTDGLSNESAVLAIVPKESATVMNYSLDMDSYRYGSNATYYPKNNKLDCFPYKYLLVSNNNGGSAIYQYEHFKQSEGTIIPTIDFSIAGAITPGCSIRLTPLRYKGVDNNDEEGLNLGKYPICNWTSDEYTNWLTQNSVNIGLNIASGVGQIVAGAGVAIGTAGVGGVVGGSMAVSGVTTIANQLAQIHQMSFTPPQSRGNINCGDVITATKNNTFFFYGMSAKDEYLKIIDDYLSTYGYKCGRVKVPNKAHRPFWWYTKTVDVNIIGTSVPVNDLNKIKNCYNNGITFWNGGDHFKDYTQDNTL